MRIAFLNFNCRMPVGSPWRSALPVAQPDRSETLQRRIRAFSLIEVLVAVALLAVIVLGLLAMFGQTQKAFQVGMTQVDVLESGRVATDMISRQLAQITPANVSNAVNFRAVASADPGVSYPGLVQSLPGSIAARTNVIEEVYFLTRMNQQWQAYGYRVSATNGVGTLYQFQAATNAFNGNPGTFFGLYTNFYYSSLDNLHRVVDGVVDFRVTAYDTQGRLINYDNAYGNNNLNYSNFTATVGTNLVSTDDAVPPNYFYFNSNAVPAYVEFQLGVLEPRTLQRFKAIPYPAQTNFLARQAGAVHLFRQRVAIRTADRSIYQ